MDTFRKLAWVVVALGLLVSGYLGVARVRKRAQVRRELATLIRTDQIEIVEFLTFEKNNPSASAGELNAQAYEQVEARNERIKTLLMVDPGPYVKAQEALLDLMRKENEFVRNKGGFLRAQNELPVQLESFKLQMDAINTRVGLTGTLYGLTHDRHSSIRDFCQQEREMQRLLTQILATDKYLKQMPEVVEIARREAADSWDRAYGWIRWSGTSIETSNSIRSYPPTLLSSDMAAAVEESGSNIEWAMKQLNDQLEKSCH